MFSAIRRRMHITPSTMIATLALVFAMSGGAYAASKYLITSTKQISPKVLKSLKGAKGATGAQGLAGAAGAAGLQGPGGAAGVKGETGATGATGAAGAAGGTGPEGSFNKTLPTGKTLKGDWTVSSQAELLVGAVSFDIPLAVAPAAVHLIPAPTSVEEEKGEFPKPPTGCTGNFTNPGAEGGNLCVFAREESNLIALASGHAGKICPAGSQAVFVTKHDTVVECGTSGTDIPEEADPYGFIVFSEATAGGAFYGGTWAVTAE
jgi:hypothetical protein